MKVPIEESVAQRICTTYGLQIMYIETNSAPEEGSPKMMTYGEAAKAFPNWTIDNTEESINNNVPRSSIEIYCHNNKYWLYCAYNQENCPKINFYLGWSSLTIVDGYSEVAYSSYEGLEEQITNLLGLAAPLF